MNTNRDTIQLRVHSTSSDVTTKIPSMESFEVTNLPPKSSVLSFAIFIPPGRLVCVYYVALIESGILLMLLFKSVEVQFYTNSFVNPKKPEVSGKFDIFFLGD